MVELDRYIAPHRYLDSIDNGWPGFDNGWGYTDPVLGSGPYAPVPTAAVCAVNPTPCGPVVTCNPIVTGPRPESYTSLCGPAGCGPVPFHAEPIGRPCGTTVYPTAGHYYGNGSWFYDDCGLCGCSSGSCCGHVEPIHHHGGHYYEEEYEEEEEFEEVHYYVDEDGKRKLVREVRLPRESSVLKNGNLRRRGRNLPQRASGPKTSRRKKIVTVKEFLDQKQEEEESKNDGIVYHHHHHFSVDTPKSQRNLAPVVEYKKGDKHVHFYHYDEEEEQEEQLILIEEEDDEEQGFEEEEEQEEQEEFVVEEHIVHRPKRRQNSVASFAKRRNGKSYGLNGKIQ